MTSVRLNLRLIVCLAVTLSCGLVLALGGGVAGAATTYSQSGSFPVGLEAVALAVDQSPGSFAGDVYDAERRSLFGFSPAERLARSVPPFAALTQASSTTFGTGTSFTGVAVDPVTGDVFALATNVDTNEDQVEEFDPSAPDTESGGVTVPASAIAKIGAGTISAGDQARIWVDSSGDVFVPDRAKDVVDEFSPSGPATWTLTREIGGPGVLSEPTGVAVDANGNVYVLDTVTEGEALPRGRVQEFSAAGALEGVLGQEGVLANAQAVTVSLASNEVFVVDGLENADQVDVFAASEGGVPGERFTHFGSGGISGVVSGIALDASSNVYVAQAATFPFESPEVVTFAPGEGPDAKTGSPNTEEITQTSAAIMGTVNPNGLDTHWYFEYGLTQGYGQDSPALPGLDAGEENRARQVSLANEITHHSGITDPPGDAPALSGLEPNATYHYQLVAENQAGVAEGGDRTFTTLPEAPTVSTPSSSAITTAGAVVSALVNPNNQATTYYFQYGTDTHYALGGAPVTPVTLPSGFGYDTANASLGGLQPNTLYHYRVVAVNATGTSYGLDHTFTTVPDAPSVSTGAVSGIGQGAGTLTGTIDPQGVNTSYYFEYSGPRVFSFISGEAGSGNGPVTVSAAAGGLTAGVTYQYRLVATSAGGTVFGAYQTFTTKPSLAGAPGVATGGVSNIEPGAAQLEGTVDPRGGPTTYHFDYGTTGGYGASAPAPEAGLGSATSPEAVSLSIGSLAPGAVYHYRLVATNADGTSYGADQTFTTPAAPVSAYGPPAANSIAPSTAPKPAAPKALTRAQKLANALKACKRRTKTKRAACEAQARKQYGTLSKKGTSKKKR
jgi:hypothetical protein